MLRFALLAAILCAVACTGRSSEGARQEEGASKYENRSPEPTVAAAPAPPPAERDAMAMAEGAQESLKQLKQEAAERKRPVKISAGALSNPLAVDSLDDSEIVDAAGGGKKKIRVRDIESPTRAWFPETFLFEPRVVTDASGAATVPVRVPDRLTTWRVLALGHTRGGAQGGAVTSFLGTLPAYVDPVVPPFLVLGDEVRVPIQRVNTTGAAIASELSVEVSGATFTAPRGAREVPARSSVVEYMTLKPARTGRIQIRASLGETDEVVRTIDVLAQGRPILTSHGGTLAAPRTVAVESPAGADPATSRARLMVFPGALALLRSELGASTARSGVADDAYALLLAGRAPALLGKLGDKPDPVALRDLAVIAAQRVVRHARTLDFASASALTAAALAHPENPVLVRLGERAAGWLHQQQRPDGTFAGGAGWTLQRVLIATADGARAAAAAQGSPELRRRALAVSARATGAFERNAAAITDGYTAAAMLATGGVTGPLVATLRERVRAGLDGNAGGKWLRVDAGVVRADGAVPSRAEATAFAVLALAGDPKAGADLADLGATLLGSYLPAAGWADGHANLVCMDAVLALFKDPIPANVKITLTLDGKPVAEGSLDREKLRDVLVLDAPGAAGAHVWGVSAEPAIPGLGYSLALQSYVPWSTAPISGGLELAVPAKITAAVGKPVELAISAAAPSGAPLRITHALPAGVQIDRPSLEALVESGALTRFEAADGRVTLDVPARSPGQVFAAKYRAIPTLAGTLHSAASRIAVDAHAVDVPPSEWIVK